jgi:streptomycin 3"-adenylyltransferase
LLGSIAFPGFEPRSGDIDFYIILRRQLTPTEKKALDTIHRKLSHRFRHGKALDGFYLPLTKARRKTTPTRLVFAANGRLHSKGTDDAWTLHRQHLRRGACLVLYGPEPKAIVPSASWHETEAALNMEVSFAKKIMHKYPFWTVLNLCRLIYSYENRQVVISKIQAAEWALRELPTQWRILIRSALRVYSRKHEDQRMLKKNTSAFFKFALDRIAEAKATVRKRPESSTNTT